MSLPVLLRRVAQAEFDEAASRYEQQRAGLGVSFTAAVRKALSTIGRQPELYAEVCDHTREALVHGYPYAIYYRPESEQIVILAVFHTSRDPSEWQRRA
jgi:toxin ParE1/3/4